MNSDKAQAIINDVDRSIEALAQSTDTLRQSDEWKKMLRIMSTFHAYSLNNQIAILRQRPDASRVAGYGAWQKLGRHVTKGAKGIAILAPMVVKIDKPEDPNHGDKRIAGFRVVHVFAQEDTSGEEIASISLKHAVEDGGMLPTLEAAVNILGVELAYDDTLGGGIYGYSKGGKIVIRGGLPAGEACSIIAHELAHELLHKRTEENTEIAVNKQVREIEAESTAYAVMQHFGIQTDANVYLAQYEANGEAIKASLGRIRHAVTAILEAVEQASGNVADVVLEPLTLAA